MCYKSGHIISSLHTAKILLTKMMIAVYMALFPEVKPFAVPLSCHSKSIDPIDLEIIIGTAYNHSANIFKPSRNPMTNPPQGRFRELIER